MKRIVFLLSLTFLLSCSKNDTQEAIENSIMNDAMGVELNPKFEEISVIKTVTVRESINGMKQWFHDDEITKMSDKEFRHKLQEEVDDAYDDTSVKRSRQALNRIDQYLGKSDNEIAYKIVKANYSVKNPLMNNATVHVSNVYFIDYENNVLFHVSSDEWEGVMANDDLPDGMEGIEQIIRVAYAKEL